MSLWNNDGEVAEGALVGVQVTVRRVGRNGGPQSPISPALLHALEAALAEFVAESAELRCWLDEDGDYWHAELVWTDGLGDLTWGQGAPSADGLAGDMAAFAAWAERVAAWLWSKPVADLPSTTVLVLAQYGKSWTVPFPEQDSGGPEAKDRNARRSRSNPAPGAPAEH
jgi:hypothetical protein